ncbi:MAG: cobalamin-dependent protein [Syntrophobacterales bacterium]|nr:cobalamin-dependent protein [Syntrophobacterales bacterium]
MRVAVIAPPYPLAEAPAPPLGVSYVAAAFLAAGAEVRIFDYIVRQYTPAKLHAELEAFRPDVVGATSVTMNFPQAASILEEAKRHMPEIVTVMGGPHVSFTAAETLQTYPGIDLIVMGEGEDTIEELVNARFKIALLPRIRGIAFRSGAEVRVNEARPFIPELDRLPLPARHLLPLSRYRALGYPISIITGRGCPYECIFCQGRRMVGMKVRHRSASLVVDEIVEIMSYGIDRINIADDLFVSDRKKVREVCGEIRRRGLNLTWSAFARVNTVDRETLEIMKDAGCDSISFGVESGNPEMLARIKKRITLDQVRRAVRLCNEVGILAHTSFVVGLPGESPQTLADTKRFAASLGSLYGYHILAPFPGTTVREQATDYDLEILTDDWTRYDANQAVTRTSRLSPGEIDAFVAEFEAEIMAGWERQVRNYGTGDNTPEEDLHVAGYFRTQLVYRLFSEDLIETLGTAEGMEEEGAFRELLCRRVEKATGFDGLLVRRTLGDFIARGFLKAVPEKAGRRWIWTHNNRVDVWS